MRELHEKAILNEDNTLAVIIKFLAIVFLIIGIILAFVISNQTPFLTIITLIFSIIIMLLFLCISEFLQMLHDIRRKIYKK